MNISVQMESEDVGGLQGAFFLSSTVCATLHSVASTTLFSPNLGLRTLPVYWQAAYPLVRRFCLFFLHSEPE